MPATEVWLALRKRRTEPRRSLHVVAYLRNCRSDDASTNLLRAASDRVDKEDSRTARQAKACHHARNERKNLSWLLRAQRAERETTREQSW
eukprot:2343479-Pleurochrysis_carterae.AAC.4